MLRVKQYQCVSSPSRRGKIKRGNKYKVFQRKSKHKRGTKTQCENVQTEVQHYRQKKLSKRPCMSCSVNRGVAQKQIFFFHNTGTINGEHQFLSKGTFSLVTANVRSENALRKLK